MLRRNNIDRICLIVLAAAVVITCGYLGAASLGMIGASETAGYSERLFDQTRVHTIDILMDDWDAFLETCQNEEYAACTVVIDGESQGSVAIRAKGNTSLSSVAQYGNDRYSFKIEFDQYENGKSYYGLDKLSLNNLIQDKTYLKDYMAYTLMNEMGVAAPLCSFVNITVNGEEWGLYLAVEGVEDSFLLRNYGADYGKLYKPDSLSFGGGRGQGKDFDMREFSERFSRNSESTEQSEEHSFGGSAPADPKGGGFDFSSMPQGGFSPAGFDLSAGGNAAPSFSRDMPDFSGGGMPDFSGGGAAPEFSGGGMPDFSGGAAPDFSGGAAPDFSGGGMLDFSGGMPDFSGGMPGMGGMGDSDVRLQYTDDNPDSYPNIWNGAKTDITSADQHRLIASLKQLSEQENTETIVDIESVIRYLVVHNFMCNDDSYTGMMVHNYYLYEEDGQLSLIPWDYNLSLGGFSMGGMGGGDGATSIANSPIDSPVSMGDVSSRPMVGWIFKDEAYTQLYHEIYAEFIDQIFTSGWFDTHMSSVIEMISPYVQQDNTAFFTYDEFKTGAQTLMEFSDLRAKSISGQLSGEIPSTTAAQRSDSSSLIDASHLSLSDMGEFGMGGGFPNMPGGSASGDSSGFGKSRGDRASAPDSGMKPDFTAGMPEGFAPPFASSGADAGEPAQFWLLALCIILLLAAILFVKFSKPHQ